MYKVKMTGTLRARARFLPRASTRAFKSYSAPHYVLLLYCKEYPWCTIHVVFFIMNVTHNTEMQNNLNKNK